MIKAHGDNEGPRATFTDILSGASSESAITVFEQVWNTTINQYAGGQDDALLNPSVKDMMEIEWAAAAAETTSGSTTSIMDHTVQLIEQSRQRAVLAGRDIHEVMVEEIKKLHQEFNGTTQGSWRLTAGFHQFLDAASNNYYKNPLMELSFFLCRSQSARSHYKRLLGNTIG